MTGRFARQRAVVIGFGASGRAAAAVLRAEGAEVLVTEARTLDQLAGDRPHGSPGDEKRDLDVEIRAEGHRPEHLDGASLIVVSPGVPEWAEVLGWARQRGIPVWSELELGARLCRVPFVAVTGTNGKTTTVELVAGMLRAGGLRVRACGNVGHPFSVAASEDVDALAVEASSFQLRFSHSFHPRVSVLLNLAPDHTDWHGSFRAYAEAKARIMARQSGEDVHVGNLDDHDAAEISRGASCRVAWFRSGPPQPGQVGLEEGRVVSRLESEAVELGAPRAPGPAILSDAAAAALAALEFGVPVDAVREGIERFEALPHRGSVVADDGRVRFVDDSKATNPHAALAALAGRSGVVLIAGGLAKGVDLSPLASAARSLAAVVAIGEAAPEVVRVFAGPAAPARVPVRLAASMDEAVEVAFGLAPAGGTVLLAPACASQDMFRDYRERGLRFAHAARALTARTLAAERSAESSTAAATPDSGHPGPDPHPVAGRSVLDGRRSHA